jgi:Domain of unknown function (DUF5666)/Putative binding domain, N-terminal
VSVSRECSWSASSAASWVVITSGSQGQGDGTIAFRIDANPDPVSRASALTIGEGRIELAQQAAPCRFDVGRPAENVPASITSLQAQIGTHSACAWTAASEAPWMAVSPDDGRGPATVGITVTANTGDTRSGFVMIAGDRIPLTQAAAAAPPPPPPTPPPPTPPPPTPTPTPPPPGGDVEVKGKVSGLVGTCTSAQFTIDKTVVVTTPATTFRRGPCRDLQNGIEVKVLGRFLASGVLEAREIELRDDNEDNH